jgi:hypothetical protein
VDDMATYSLCGISGIYAPSVPRFYVSFAANIALLSSILSNQYKREANSWNEWRKNNPYIAPIYNRSRPPQFRINGTATLR